MAFKHPVEYLDPSMVHVISSVVCNDLELESMYHIAFKPQHKYAEQMIHQWKTKFTSDIDYLRQTQQVVANCKPFESCAVDTHAIDTVFNDVFTMSGFCDRYCYIDIEHVKFVNENSTFMGFWTVANLLSPLISLVLPLLLLVAPFILLKIQGVPISFDAYLSILKSLALKHSLGKAFSSFDSTSLNGLVYLLFSLAMYGIQTYQNIKSCIRFYNNIYTVNTNLIAIQTFLKTTLQNMKSFLVVNAGFSKYSGFCADLSDSFDKLSELQRLLSDIQPYHFGFGKMFEIGNLLKCYYALQKYKDCIQYAMAFEGYIDNLRGIQTLNSAEFVNAELINAELINNTCIENQVYPVLLEAVKNTVDLSNNIIITGPNASGKTTVLKTTAINIIFTQQFGAGYYSKCVLKPYTQIHSYLNIPDTSGRDSLFQAEARRCKEILDIVDSAKDERHFCIFDELFSGTNAEEATVASVGLLNYIQSKSNVDFMLTTHFTNVPNKIAGRIMNMKMDATLEANSIHFTYNLVPGISEIKAAKLILIQMGFPDDVLSAFACDDA
jgi:hypothetical protein